ncbi:peptidoglycan-binding domain-containing protein [Streptomyces sp. NPDC049910]|uniref:peptidoglycan-binding domain-containing protein n=1 Tax=Streptomyces sp. NPDC049910 TaxID=3155278 RepID=UPI003435FE1C
MSVPALITGRRRAALSVAAAVLAAALALAIGILVGPSVRSPAQAVADAAPPASSPVTVAAERRVLAEPVITRGTVRPGTSVKVTAPAGLSGDTAVVTRVVVRAGTPLDEGTVLAEVSGAPLFGLVLPFPLYRDMGGGMRGPDVTAVQTALRRLGTGVRATGTFDAATGRAVERLYRSRGYPPPRQGKSAMLPRTGIVALDRDGRTVSAVRVRVGSVLRDPAPVLLELDTAEVTVRATVDAGQRALVRTGTTAAVVDESGGAVARAVVRAVADRPGADGYTVTLAFTGDVLPPVEDRTVLVTIDPARKTGPVLAVPVAAVYARPDTVTFVTVEGEGRRLTDVVVGTGRIAGGWVHVTPKGPGLDAGTRVVVGRSGGAPGAGGEDGP